jgi:hypothetical protein
MYYRRPKFCIIYLALNRGCFEVVLIKNTLGPLGVKIKNNLSEILDFIYLFKITIILYSRFNVYFNVSNFYLQYPQDFYCLVDTMEFGAFPF